MVVELLVIGTCSHKSFGDVLEMSLKFKLGVHILLKFECPFCNDKVRSARGVELSNAPRFFML